MFLDDEEDLKKKGKLSLLADVRGLGGLRGVKGQNLLSGICFVKTRVAKTL